MGKIVRQVAAYFSVTSLVSYVLSSPPSSPSQPSSTPILSLSSLRFWNGIYSQAAAYQVQTDMLSSVSFLLTISNEVQSLPVWYWALNGKYRQPIF